MVSPTLHTWGQMLEKGGGFAIETFPEGVGTQSGLSHSTQMAHTLSFVVLNYGAFVRDTWGDVASSPGPSQILSRSRGEKSGKAWDQNYVTDRKWWTR